MTLPGPLMVLPGGIMMLPDDEYRELERQIVREMWLTLPRLMRWHSDFDEVE